MKGLRPHEQPLTHADVKALARCVRMADDWRGSIPPVSPNDDIHEQLRIDAALQEFDAHIKRARLALRKVRELKRQGL